MRRILVATILLALVPITARATDCSTEALGTSRVLAVDPKAAPQVGRKQFPDTLPLADHEVVLTFDDGPWPTTTPRVLDALAHACVRATFFLLGRNAAAHPALARRELAEGHTVASHSFAHPLLDRRPQADAEAEIDRGIAAVDAALQAHTAPFFRFPGFASTPALLDRLVARQIVVFGADLWASDWNPMTPAQELDLLMSRLTAAGSGIVLLHDTKAQTAAMLPSFLRALQAGRYRVVHVVPADQ